MKALLFLLSSVVGPLLLCGSLLSGCQTDAAAAGTAPASSPPSLPPRILLLEADHMGWGDLNCYGNFLVESPHLDRLASDGVLFTQAYVGDLPVLPLTDLARNGYDTLRFRSPQSDVATTNELLAALETANPDRWAAALHFRGPARPERARPDLVATYQTIIDSSHWRPYPTVNYAAKVAEIDEQAGRVIDWLRRRNQLDSTLIVFTSSGGGPVPNGPLRDGGGSLHEGGIRVPCIVHYPAATTQTRSQVTPVTTDDVHATVSDLLRTPAPDAGRSLLPLLRGEAFPNRYLYWMRGDSAAVRFGRHKLLYDLRRDSATYYDLQLFPDESEGSAEGPGRGLRAALDRLLAGRR